MNVVMAGNIPVAAGLSSSSAIVVASAEGIIKLNNLEIPAQQFVELCGEAEWYVGTRGGAGDHASMKFARKGHVVQVSFFPLEVVDTVPFPANHVFVVCNSHEKARKTAGARDIFNHRVACYNIGREIIKQEFPKYAPAIEHLRDLNTRKLGIDFKELLDILKLMPVTMNRSEVMSRLPVEQAERYLSSHSASLDSYPIRSVLMYGLAECERSRMCAQLLRRGDAVEFGRWMNISHNDDRVVSWDGNGNSLPFNVEYSDETMDELIAKAESSNEGNLVQQPGGYSCSIPKIDRMIDIALSVPGVMGAEIMGAGLGGCIAVLVHRDFAEQLEQSMIRSYYAPSDLEPDMFVCYPVAGSGLINY
jgi:N-acetylgalactosamine kinase